MNHIRTIHCNTLHSTFCTPFSSLELSIAISQLSTSTSSGPDQIIYLLLTHLPQSALHFLLYIFKLSWSTHTFPSTWKQSTTILKLGKPSDSPSSYRPISLTSCTSKLFERMVLGRLTYFLEQKGTLSPVQAGFRPGRSTVDQVLLLSQSIADSFHQSKPGTRTVLATVDFAKAFDSVWHSALLSKLISLDLLLCFVEWIRSYLSDRRSKVRICNSYSRPFRLRREVSQGSVLDQFSFPYISTTFLLSSLHLLKPHSMQMTSPFGPPPRMLSVQLPQYKLPSIDWWNGPQVAPSSQPPQMWNILLQPRPLPITFATFSIHS